MIVKRIRDLAVATIHEGLDQLENPVVMLNQYLRDMEKEIKQAEEAITKQTMLQANFLKEKHEAEKILTKREEQAEIAMKTGEEELAKKALMSKQRFAEKVHFYTEITEQNETKIVELKQQLAALRDKYREMKDRKYALMARANVFVVEIEENERLFQFRGETLVVELPSNFHNKLTLETGAI